LQTLVGVDDFHIILHHATNFVPIVRYYYQFVSVAGIA
jgi:hypothetical protein